MANVKISALPAAAALDGSELVPIVQGAATVKATIDEFFSRTGGGEIDLGTGVVLTGGAGNAIAITATTTGTITLTTAVAGGLLSLQSDAWKARAVTVANLPAAATAGIGARGFVTDASTTVILGLGLAVVGSGANKVPVYSDGTVWRIG